LQQFLPSTFLDLRVFYRVEPTDKICPMWARLCPDGSSVGPTGVNCDVAPCPGEVCTDDVVFCADGTQIGRTGSNCEFACPPDSKSVSAKNYTQISAIELAFWDRYGDEYPYTKYLIGSSIKTLASMNKSHAIVLTNDETWGSYCLSVTLVDFPSNVTFPDVYLGARVFYSILGKDICPLSTRVTCASGGSSLSIAGIFVPIVILLLAVGCAGFCCRLRRRKCACKSQKCQGFQRLPVEEPTPTAAPVMMTPMMIPAEFDVDMMNGEQLPYEAMMIPVGYPPMYGHPQQHVWFVPPPQTQQPQQK